MVNDQSKVDGLIKIILASYISNMNPQTKWDLVSMKL